MADRDEELRVVPRGRSGVTSGDLPHRATDAALREPVVWTVADLAAVLQCTRSWIYDQVEAQRLPVVRLGRQLRFRPDDIADWLAAQAQATRDPDPVAFRSHRRRSRRRTPPPPPALPP